jgi:hypothetical protein
MVRKNARARVGMLLPAMSPRRLTGAAAIACAAALIPAAALAATASPARGAATGPALAYSSNLSSVSCPRASWCMAVGSSSASPTSPSRTLAETRTGTSWRMLTTPNPAGTAASSLASVSCTSAARCIAVGDHGTQTLAEAWNGTSWRILKTPALASSSLASVSCTSAARCIAVGDHGARALAEAWNGTSWRTLKTRSPARSSLTSVSCTAAARCMAVGGHDVRDGLPVGLYYGLTFAEAWNGTSWRILRTPKVGLGSTSTLESVSCSRAFRCMAVGGSSQNQGAAGFPSFAEAWNGTSWRLVTTANPRTGFRWLTGVSCTGADHCMAVGNSRTIEHNLGTGAFAEVWNGTTWHLLKVPGPRSLADGLGLAGVSCPLPSRCIATGSFISNLNLGSVRILAEAWNGTRWHMLRPLNP